MSNHFVWTKDKRTTWAKVEVTAEEMAAIRKSLRRLRRSWPQERCALCDEWALGNAGVWLEGEKLRLCHDDSRSCYHRWTVYGDRP